MVTQDKGEFGFEYFFSLAVRFSVDNVWPSDFE